MSERTLQLRVGLFVLGALVLLAGLVLVLGNFSLGPTYRVDVDFAFSGAVHPGAPVKVSGVELGRVERVTFLGGEVRDARGRPVMVRLTLALEERARPVVRTDSEFFVNTQGVLGEPYVEIVPGALEGEVLAPGSIIRGVDPPRTDLLLARAYILLDRLARGLTENEDLFRDLLASSSGLARTLDEVLRDNREALVRALAGIARAVEDLRRITELAAAQLAEGGDLAALIVEAREAVAVLRKDLPPVLADAGTAAAELARLSKVTGELDAEDAARVERALEHFENATRKFEGLTGDLDALMSKVERGDGTVGALLQDEQIYDDLKELLRDLKQHPWKVVWKE